MQKKYLAIYLLLVFALLSGSCSNRTDKSLALQSNLLKPKALKPIRYSAASPFNQKIPFNPEIDPNSAIMVQSLLEVTKNQGFILCVTGWTYPVYYADVHTPRYEVKLTASWAKDNATKMKNVPIPDFALADPQEDGGMVIIDPATKCEYDFWQARKRKGQWSASWANSIKIDGNGIYPKGLSARGSGFALLAGLIWPEELKNGKIEHALLFSYNYTKAGGPVSPATESDGNSKRPDAIPEGARIQLDPTLDLDSLNLTPYEKTIARALQEYGMILGDTGGGISLYALHPMSLQDNPYVGILPQPDTNEGFVFLNNIPVERLRVLNLPPQNNNPDLALVNSGCVEME